MTEIFVSADIEADGSLVGVNSMLSLGSVAFRVGQHGYEQLSTFEANLLECPGAVRDEQVMQWWNGHPKAWQKIRENPQPPAEVMKRYLGWINALSGKVSLVAYPASYDFMFIYWYLLRFTGERPFGWAALCSKTYAMAALKKESWSDFSKDDIPARFRSSHPHDHTPLNDAIEQGQEFAAMYRYNVLFSNHPL